MSRHGHILKKTDDGGVMICPESKFRYREIEPGVLRCLDLAEDAKLPVNLGVGSILYNRFEARVNSLNLVNQKCLFRSLLRDFL